MVRPGRSTGHRAGLAGCCLVVLLAGCGPAQKQAVPVGQPAGTPSGTSASASGAVERVVAPGRPKVLVAVTSPQVPEGRPPAPGILVVLDPADGTQRRRLDVDVLGDAVQLGPDGATVYYARDVGCRHEIWTVPVAGGKPARLVADGALPALSPDGTELAYWTGPLAWHCADVNLPADSYAVVVRTLATGASRRLALGPDRRAIPAPVRHLSWSPDGTRLAVSVGSAQDNRGWALNLVDPVHDRYYVGGSSGTAVPAAGPATAGRPGEEWFFREGVYLPGGSLFAVHRCCINGPETQPILAEVLQEVDAATGAQVRQVAVGIVPKDHASLGSDASGRWLIYLSGDAVMVAADGAKPVTLTTGYQAVDW